MKFNSICRQTHISILIIFMVFAVLSGCKKINPQPFSDFSSSVQELRKGSDVALKYNDVSNRNRFIDEVSVASTTIGGAESVQNLLIQSEEGTPFGWKMDNVPLFMMSPQFRSGVYTMNSTLLAYSELLASLADSTLVSQKEFDALAKDLDGNLKAVATTLEFDGIDKGIGIFSVAASKAAHAYIDSKRKGKLKEILEKNQPVIIDISKMLQKAISIAVRNLRQDYDQRSMKLARQLVPSSSLKLEARKKVVTALIELNEDFVTRLKVLESLNNSYRSLPAAHVELTKAIEEPGYNLTAVKGLYEDGKHLYELFKEIQSEKK